METDDLRFLQPLFLGPSAENADLLESLLIEFLRDHVYWRRNFHPEDGLRISTGAHYRPDFLETQARIRSALYELSAELKRAVPFYHPRYVGHMSSDLLLPGLVAKLVTTLYNPNNVSEEAAPVTLEMELEAGRDLARMFGFSVDESREPCAWGHLTGGGTVANYEALWNFRSVKFYGIALQEGARVMDFATSAVGPAAKPLAEYSKWELLNLSIDETIALRRQIAHLLDDQGSRRALFDFVRAVRSERIEHLGTAGFFQKHADVPPPRVLVSSSAHYSWAKGMKALGFGTANLVRIRVDDHMRMDPTHLDEELRSACEAGAPVLAVVGMLGTTEFGTVDPIHRIVEARARCRAERGFDFGIHVDAAWGGYLTSVFRNPDGSMASRAQAGVGLQYFPGETLYAAFAALPEVDSITVDPHKLGYVPYPAGAFVARNREVVDFIAQEAAYVFDLGDREHPVSRSESLHKLGQYILEGSKPGSAAAAVHVTHKVLPLHREGLGRVLKETIRTCEYFWDAARAAAERLSDRVRLVVPFEPDSNLICLALNPVGNTDLAAMNRFGREVFQHMKVEGERPLQTFQFIGSYTSLTCDALPAAEARRILDALGIDPTTFVQVPEDTQREADHVFILRHTLMNPWQLDGPGGRTYVGLYLEWLEDVVDGVLEGEGWR
ncbi:MAG: pyridoxal-dependent decarboxylase [Gemmatimonadota bacterium]